MPVSRSSYPGAPGWPVCDAFAGLFGSRRGTPGRERETLLSAPAPALLSLLGHSTLPVGLTLLVGPAGAGKTAAAAFLATELSAHESVSYLDADDKPVMSLLDAQTPTPTIVSLPLPLRSPETTLLTGGHLFTGSTAVRLARPGWPGSAGGCPLADSRG